VDAGLGKLTGLKLMRKSKLIKVCEREVRIRGWVPRMAQLEGDAYEFLDNPEAMIESLRTCGHRIDLFSFTQKITDSAPRYTYPMEQDNFAAVPVSTFDHWWNHQIKPEVRNRARQAEKKGVVIREVPFSEELVEGIWKIYNESPVRQGRPFPHYGKSIERVYAEEATFLERSIFIGAFLESELIGFVKITADETWSQANLMNILSMMKFRDKAPTNALIAHSVRTCANRGISYLVYQQFSYGNKQWDGIMKFKQINGFQKFDVPRYYVALTPLGDVCYRLGLHHRFVDRLPESFVSNLRDARNNWYNRKLQTVKESS
jgi:hypothetical protein